MPSRSRPQSTGRGSLDVGPRGIRLDSDEPARTDLIVDADLAAAESSAEVGGVVEVVDAGAREARRIVVAKAAAGMRYPDCALRRASRRDYNAAVLARLTNFKSSATLARERGLPGELRNRSFEYPV